MRGNLEFVRNQVQGATVHSHWGWLEAFTLNEVTGLAAGLFWLALVLLTVRQLRPSLAPALRGATFAAVFATVFAGAVLAVQATGHFSGQSAVVIGANVMARSGPFEEAQPVFAIHDGAELPVLARHEDWLQVTDGSGKIGWLPRHQLELLPGA